MFQKPNIFRQKLNSGQTLIGTVMLTWSPAVMELAGLAGLDFVRIDNEHSWRQDSSAEHLMRAANLMGIMAIMRVDRDNPYLIRKALEIGALGVLVPDVHDAKEAEAIVKAAKFPPMGTRGYSGQNWSGGWGTRAGRPWVEWSNSEPMIGVMIENKAAIKNLDDILAVDGLDFVHMGPADYSMSLGLGAPDKNHPEVQRAINKVITTARKRKIPVVLGVGQNIEQINKYKDMGVNMLELASDLTILHSNWSKIKNAIG
jgi:4-hydroxy-2-oxoheptanedioate aldolase